MSNYFPWNGAHLGASIKGVSLESLADGSTMDACYGARRWPACLPGATHVAGLDHACA
jgi:hypothetical protein